MNEAKSPDDWYALIRSQVEHEDDLISQRLSWLVASQSFLFTACAITNNSPLQFRNSAMAAQQQLLHDMIPLIGIAISGLIYFGLIAGIRTMFMLRKYYQLHVGQEMNHRPPIQALGSALILGHLAPLLLPFVFIAAWLLLWLRSPGF